MHDRLVFTFAVPNKCAPVSHGTGVKKMPLLFVVRRNSRVSKRKFSVAIQLAGPPFATAYVGYATLPATVCYKTLPYIHGKLLSFYFKYGYDICCPYSTSRPLEHKFENPLLFIHADIYQEVYAFRVA